MLINVLKSTDFANAAYRLVKNRHFSANIVLCAENVSENEKSGKAEYSYFVPALWHLLLPPPLTPIVYLPRFLSCTSFYRRLISLFFAPHLVRIFRRTQIDAPRRGRRPRRPASAHRRVPAYSRLSLRRGRRPRRPVARFQPRYKKVPHRIACTPLIAAAPVPHAETHRSVIVQWDCCVHIGGFPNTGAPR